MIKARVRRMSNFISCFLVIVFGNFTMNNTELVTVVVPQSVTNPLAFEDRERASPRPQHVEGEPTNNGGMEQELAPVDGGSAAWRLLFAAFMFETLLWGEFLLCVKSQIFDVDKICN
jgi:hypothetical protein